MSYSFNNLEMYDRNCINVHDLNGGGNKQYIYTYLGRQIYFEFKIIDFDLLN